jgi:capsular polysaccharide biosynthesis protein
MSYLDQLNLLYNATHIAGTIGSAFINTFICKENTNLIEIHVKKDYHFSYEYITNMFNINRLEINLKYLDDIKHNWVQKEIDELKLELDKYSSFYE